MHSFDNLLSIRYNNNMKLLMDADCLIKLTKAGLKETVCQSDTVFIPAIVVREVVDAGKIKGCSDAFAVEKNISLNLISIIPDEVVVYETGDRAVSDLFNPQKYDAVATDDAKLIRKLKSLGIPFLLPGLILYLLHKQGEMDKVTSLWALDQLAPFISDDEYSTVRLLMEAIK